MNRDNTARAREAAEQLSVLIPYMQVEALVDLVMIGNDACHGALARSNPVKAPVAAGLTEIADEPAILHLLANPTAAIAPFSYIRMIERFANSEPILGAIEARDNVTKDVWAALAAARLKAIVDMIEDQSASDVVEQALIALLWAAEGEVRQAYIAAFIRFDCVTPKLISVALSNDAFDVVVDLLSELSGEATAVISGILARSDGLAFREILKRAGFPVSIIIECEAAFLRATAKPTSTFAVAA